jgi:hypothetical protein
VSGLRNSGMGIGKKPQAARREGGKCFDRLAPSARDFGESFDLEALDRLPSGLSLRSKTVEPPRPRALATPGLQLLLRLMHRAGEGPWPGPRHQHPGKVNDCESPGRAGGSLKLDYITLQIGKTRKGRGEGGLWIGRHESIWRGYSFSSHWG